MISFRRKWKRVRGITHTTNQADSTESALLKEEEKAKVEEKNKNEVTAAVNGASSEDVKKVIELLEKISKDNDNQMKYIKRQSLFSSISLGICGVLVIALIIICANIIPTVNRVVADAEGLIASTNDLIAEVNTDIGTVVGEAETIMKDAQSIMDEADTIAAAAQESLTSINGMMGEVEEVVANVNTITDTIAKQDIAGMVQDVNGLVVTGEESIEVALEKINAVDFDSLNNAITDLGKIIAPLAKLFGGRK